MSDLAYWIALNSVPQFGPRRFKKLRTFFPSMKDAFYADRNMLIAAGITPKTVNAFLHLRDQLSPEQLLERMQRASIQAVTLLDDAYPSLLKQIYDPPPVLFYKGTLSPIEVPHVAIVGSRKATPYGLRAASHMAQALAAAGVIVVSGLAYGIDEAAHSAAVKTKGHTIAILACGILSLSSRQRYLADRIVDASGAVMSEFPISAHAMKQNFPVRNRIISGMSHGTFVVEAAKKSGSLITARAALEQNRDVFALPGPITSETSEGTNELIKLGANCVTEPGDILHALQIDTSTTTPVKPKPDSKEEALILDLLSKHPVHIDELTRCTQLPVAKVAGTLSIMEMKGRTKQIGGMYYVLT